jgi:aryl-alcohol dehydrogenase-like predicted oxidoreductase
VSGLGRGWRVVGCQGELEAACEHSLKSLGTDRLDILRLFTKAVENSVDKISPPCINRL